MTKRSYICGSVSRPSILLYGLFVRPCTNIYSSTLGFVLFFKRSFLKNYLFWLYWVFVAVLRLSLVATNGGYSPVAVGGLLTAGFSWLGGSVLVVHGFISQWHVGSYQTRDGTHFHCIGRWILNYWTTRDVPIPSLDTGSPQALFFFEMILSISRFSV